MAKFIDLTGQVFGSLTVISVGPKSGVSTRFNCKCKCGNTGLFFANNLRRGLTASCGCLRSEVTTKRNTSHGKSNTETYDIWCGIVKRCTNPNDKNFSRYGGRGISVCDRWLAFENFIHDMGERPAGQSIDRIDNGLGYRPDNCRWASKETQANNTRTNRFIKCSGVTKTLSEWAAHTGYKRELIANRLNRGWSAERTLTTPPIEKFRNGLY